MSSKPKKNGNAESKETSAPVAKMGEAPAGNSVRDEEIRLRAYEIYLERAQGPGSDLDDWLQAELELKAGVRARAHAG